MKQEADLISARLKTPRAAAIAGIVFSVLMISGLLLFRISIPGNPLEADTWLKTSSGTLVRTLYMVPFAGIAFLWFIGVIRDLLGELEDQCFATVFLGSGLLFVAMLFASAAVTGGMIMAYRARPAAFLDSVMYTFAYTVAYEIMDLYAVKMAAVFMISTSTVAIHTGVFARWIMVRVKNSNLADASRSVMKLESENMPVWLVSYYRSNTPAKVQRVGPIRLRPKTY